MRSSNLQRLFDGPNYLDKIAPAVATFGEETPNPGKMKAFTSTACPAVERLA